MKKLLLSSLLILLTLAGWSKDPQRLALLPIKLVGDGISEGGQLASFCIDLFRDAPENITYKELNNASADLYDVKGYNDVNTRGARLPGIKYLGTPDETTAIPAHYQAFLDELLGKYKDRESITLAERRLIQDEIWAYNGLDELGYINTSAPNRMDEFEKAAEEFFSKYCDTRDPDQKYAAIHEAAWKMHGARLREIPDISEWSFNENGIDISVSGENEHIDISYEGTDFSFISDHAQDIRNGFDMYINTYRDIPDYGVITLAPQSEKHLANFSLYGYDDYGVLNVRIPNNTGTGFEIPLHPQKDTRLAGSYETK
ncbi:hypothetical protein [Chitinophaga ginsengisoli]|uniref:Uncharacterized protein n=1 Tax=Chitinophaga ginsengisoli TaxID=363837 RepID=A0A2P8G2F2_9BACT|nr:hypothetical protein [Chitinophaga ginsengisoli]PSL28141.1 hypothetical protein CLV42_10860 [Chitinophaga ginsengisoli]